MFLASLVDLMAGGRPARQENSTAKGTVAGSTAGYGAVEGLDSNIVPLRAGG
jgi:hypothetical protein